MSLTVRSFLESYILENDLSGDTILSYRNAVAVFEKYAGPVTFADLEKPVPGGTGRQNGDLILNDWITRYAADVSPYTVKSRRATILAILADAFDMQVTTYRKMRVKSIRTPETSRDVWSPDDVAKLVDACSILQHRFQRTQIRRKYYAQSLIMAAWDTGLRRSDLLRIRWDWLADSHIFSIVTQKTKKNHVTRVSVDTRRRLLLTFDKISGDYREYCWPIWCRPGRGADRAVTDLFREPMQFAGLKCSDGVFKKLRRSSATYLKTVNGDATAHLGHSSDAVTNRHYLNHAVIRTESEIKLPPPLFR